MKILIVDDERHAREELKELLKPFPEIVVAGEAGNAHEARAKIADLNPDLVFLDVQMPEESGFDLLSSLEGIVPRVIFTTAYDSYALMAIEFGAVDYLLKPILPARLAKALHRILNAPEERSLMAPEEPSESSHGLLAITDKILLTDASRLWYVTVGSIIGAESLGAHSVIWLEGSSPVIRRSLAALEKRLPSDHFFRANRSQIINLHQVQAVEPWFSGGLKLSLTGGRSVELSRRQAKIFKETRAL